MTDVITHPTRVHQVQHRPAPENPVCTFCDSPATHRSATFVLTFYCRGHAERGVSVGNSDTNVILPVSDQIFRQSLPTKERP